MAAEWVLASVVVFLVMFAGLMSGLTLGLMSQDTMDLRVGVSFSESGGIEAA